MENRFRLEIETWGRSACRGGLKSQAYMLVPKETVDGKKRRPGGPGLGHANI